MYIILTDLDAAQQEHEKIRRHKLTLHPRILLQKLHADILALAQPEE